MKPIVINSLLLRDRDALEFCDCPKGRTLGEIDRHLERLQPEAFPVPQIVVILLVSAGYLYVQQHGTATSPTRYRVTPEGWQYCRMIADTCATATACNANLAANAAMEVTA
jgi:hypothetical protein